MKQKDIEKIVQYLKIIESDVSWLEIKFTSDKTKGEIVFVRDNENNEFRWKLANLRQNDFL